MTCNHCTVGADYFPKESIDTMCVRPPFTYSLLLLVIVFALLACYLHLMNLVILCFCLVIQGEYNHCVIVGAKACDECHESNLVNFKKVLCAKGVNQNYRGHV